MKFGKLFRQNRMAAEWGPAYHDPAVLPYPVRVARGVLDQLLPALRLAAGDRNLGDADASRAVAALVRQHLARLESLRSRGGDIVQFPVAVQSPLAAVLHVAYAERAVWLSDRPLVPYPKTDEV